MRLIFVGMHNKPGKIPLCSSTKSGKLVDNIAQGYDCVKTNLYDIDYYPSNDEKYNLACDWIRRIDVFPYDIIILLGAEVHNNFEFLHDKIIKIAHPSSQWSHEQMNDYVSKAREKITKIITPPLPSTGQDGG